MTKPYKTRAIHKRVKTVLFTRFGRGAQNHVIDIVLIILRSDV